MRTPAVASLLAAVLLGASACGGGGGGSSGGGGSERPEAGEHKTPPEDLGAPARSTYGTAYNICLNRDEEDIGDDPTAFATDLAQQYPAPYRDAGIQGCLGALIDRGLAPGP
jgi:hypothetical protein